VVSPQNLHSYLKRPGKKVSLLSDARPTKKGPLYLVKTRKTSISVSHTLLLNMGLEDANSPTVIGSNVFKSTWIKNVYFVHLFFLARNFSFLFFGKGKCGSLEFCPCMVCEL
jgi:hypothetical protein